MVACRFAFTASLAVPRFGREALERETASNSIFLGVCPVNRVAVGLLLALSLSACGAPAPNPVVVIDTSMGTIKAELYQDRAPGTVKNFLMYVDDKHYDG